MAYVDENAETRAQFIASLGIKYTARFVPQANSRNRNEKDPSLNWLVTLEANGQKIETDYMQGIGHVPGRPQHFDRTIAGQEERKAFDSAAQTGKYPSARFGRQWNLNAWAMKPLPEPTLESVLYSLVMDASARDYTFEEWASEYGYDTDSIKAEASYRACVDIGVGLLRIVGGSANLETLSNLFQGF